MQFDIFESISKKELENEKKNAEQATGAWHQELEQIENDRPRKPTRPHHGDASSDSNSDPALQSDTVGRDASVRTLPNLIIEDTSNLPSAKKEEKEPLPRAGSQPQ